jgi:dihydrolipoamide dehydrogenase
VVAGSFRFNRVGKGVVRTDGDVPPLWLEYTDVVLATGSRPTPLPGVPFDGTFVLDSTAVLELTTLPERVVVVGGGYIGLELGTALAKLGAAVTIIELQDRLLPEMDAGFSRPVAKRLSALGVEVRLGTAVTGAAGGVVTLREGSAEPTLETDCVVVAIGRTPNTDELGLDRVGVEPGERGLLTVGADRLVAPHVAAIGDITPGPALAHKASAEAEVAVAALCGHAAAFQPATIPAVVFSDPEIATAGYTAAQARAEGVDVDVARFPLAASGRAATVGASEGFAQLVIDRGMDAVIGVHIAGPHASELIAEGVLAIEMAASPEDLASSIHPHPTFSELVSEVALVAVGRPVHVQASKGARS